MPGHRPGQALDEQQIEHITGQIIPSRNHFLTMVFARDAYGGRTFGLCSYSRDYGSVVAFVSGVNVVALVFFCVNF